MNWQTLFLSPEGRIGQKDYWIGLLILMIVWIVSPVLHILAPVLWLILLYPWICVIAKRLHDFGKSGWFIMVPVIVGVVCMGLAFVFGGLSVLTAIFAAATEGAELNWGVFLAALGAMIAFLAVAGLVKLIFLLWVGLSSGDRSANRYGPPPGSPSVETPVAPVS